VNDRRVVLRDRFLGRHVRHTRLWNYFQREAEFVNFFVDKQTVAALWQAFERERT